MRDQPPASLFRCKNWPKPWDSMVCHIIGPFSKHVQLRVSYLLTVCPVLPLHWVSCPQTMCSSALHRLYKLSMDFYHLTYDQKYYVSWCLSVLGVIPQTKRSPVRFPVRAHVWVVGQVPGWGHGRGNGSRFLSLSLSLPSPLSNNK